MSLVMSYSLRILQRWGWILNFFWIINTLNRLKVTYSIPAHDSLKQNYASCLCLCFCMLQCLTLGCSLMQKHESKSIYASASTSAPIHTEANFSVWMLHDSCLLNSSPSGLYTSSRLALRAVSDIRSRLYGPCIDVINLNYFNFPYYWYHYRTATTSSRRFQWTIAFSGTEHSCVILRFYLAIRWWSCCRSSGRTQ
jgi:hypothetical protein